MSEDHKTRMQVIENILKFLLTLEQQNPTASYGGSTITETVDAFLLLTSLTREEAENIFSQTP